MAVTIAEMLTYCSLECQVSSPLNNLRPHLQFLEKQAIRVLKASGRKATLTTVPFIGRALLEGGLTALLFRFDYFRAATLVRFQSHGEFDFTRQQNISISWTGDIIPAEDTKGDIWLPKYRPEGISRALLSPYSDYIHWRPAFLLAKDYADSKGASLDFPTILSYEPELVVEKLRGEARQLYSFWSKGVHCEAFAMGQSILDSITCIEKMQRTCDLVCELAFLSQFAPVVIGSINPGRALQSYTRMKVNIHG